MINKRKYVTGLLEASMLSPLFLGCGTEGNADANTGDTEVSETAELTNGTYSAFANGYGGNVEVEVVVEDGKSTDLEMTDHAESSPVYNRAMPIAKERILEAQSPEVDSVSGATFTSYAIKKATAEALNEAGANFENITMDTRAEGAANIDPWLRDMGIELNHPYRETGHMAEADEYAGEHIQDNLEKKAYELGVDIRTGTKDLDLIMEDDKAVGVQVENREGHYNINADAVIVATGGLSHNDELLTEYAPGAERVETSNQMGATGDFIEVFKNHDLKLENMDELSVFKLIIKNRRDLTGAGDGFVLVNEHGERFTAENGGGLELAHDILDQPDGKVFYIYDARLKDSFYRLKKHNEELGYHTKADTLEELAEELNLDAEALRETIATYNQAIVDGGVIHSGAMTLLKT